MADAKQRILEILQPERMFLAALATITQDEKPWVRYVSPKIADDLTLRIATSARSNKVAQTKANPEVHLTCGITDPRTAQHYLQIQGKAAFSTDQAEKSAFWEDVLKAYWSGPDDPDYGILLIKPYRIEARSMTSMDSEVWEA
jgi:general stress protein 26